MLTAIAIALGVILILLAFIIIYGIYYITDKLESIQVNVQNLEDINHNLGILNNRVDSYLGDICNHVHQIHNRL